MSASSSGKGRGAPQRRFGSAPSTNPFSCKPGPEYEHDKVSDTWKEVTPTLFFPPSDTGSPPPVAGQSRLRSPTTSPPISRKKAKWRADLPASESSSHAEDLAKVTAILPLIALVVSGLGDYFSLENVDVVATPNLVDLETTKSMFRYLARWSFQPKTIQFLTSLPQEHSLLGAQYEYMQRRFSDIGLYPVPPPPVPTPSPMDPHSIPPPPTAPLLANTSLAMQDAQGTASCSLTTTCTATSWYQAAFDFV